MSDTPANPEPDWLDEFQDLANRMLGEDTDGSACEQVHPIVARWYDKVLQGEPPESRPSVWQAISCLATEVMADMEGDEAVSALFDHVDEEEIGLLVEHILLVGRMFEIALREGDLDDL